MNQVKSIITEDGSSTLYLPKLNEHYHSTYGAIQESNHVFIEHGLKSCTKKNSINIFEVGFGTGLNALLTFMNTPKNLSVNYFTIESMPLSKDIVAHLNYPDILDLDMHKKDIWKTIHSSAWNQKVALSATFSIKKIKGGIENYNSNENIDICYFDAFSPKVQPNIWSVEIIQKIYGSMNVGGILVTYCAKGIVRRRLNQAGFTTEKLPGPPGKREMIRARK